MIPAVVRRRAMSRAERPSSRDGRMTFQKLSDADQEAHGDVTETGSVAIVLVGIIATILLFAAALAGVAGVFVASEQARGAADESALAGARALMAGDDAATPCGKASEIARRNSTRLVRCVVDEESVQVEVSSDGPAGWDPRATARAGEPSGESSTAGSGAS